MKKITYYLTTVLTITQLFMTCAPQETEDKTDISQVPHTFCMSEQLKKNTRIDSVQYLPIQESLTLTGKVEYNENDFVAFKSLLDGRVEQVNFELGDYVQAGKVLAVIRSHDVQEQYQQKRYNESQLVLLRKQLETKSGLLSDGMASAPEILETEHAIESTQIELDKINQTLALYRADGATGNFHLIAPKNGYIVQKKISVGQTIMPDSDPLFSISNLRQVWVMVNIYANNLRYIKEGDPVKVRTLAYPDELHAGKVDKIYHVFDDDEHVLKARVVLENKQLNLIPGLGADIIIYKDQSENAYAIPNNAMVFSNNKQYVIRYQSDCDFSIQEVTPVASNDEFTFVKTDFSTNHKIVSSNALLIFDELNK
ncbi:efflux RND transporter periplasmic adaptor subunit [Sphingobacterium alkalisoli]|uniref:Efflux RND transporter periplasmic adaptor subunit n=1 Tax=Sphingobacterium alkalisoli TaxID=1874115 RepID=A0A4U0GZA3_9SPHI|nr:efflux RND transporter periplasmic adaptor subunit [Sphingobacterium alkalisoli]TJY64587.1 efflux RND transporter periplasmic adaptor subunit [Sphingobacterium alkalisoli]GGH20822.1 hemolysin D [Sphingobacterium alkalisoli]